MKIQEILLITLLSSIIFSSCVWQENNQKSSLTTNEDWFIKDSIIDSSTSTHKKWWSSWKNNIWSWEIISSYTVSHTSYWNNKEVMGSNGYLFPNISFKYPSNWKFECCHDRDTDSVHFIFPSNTRLSTHTGIPTDVPVIKIISHMWNNLLIWWDRDNPKYISSDEYLTSLNGETIPSSFPWWKIQKILETSSINYIVKVTDGFVEFQFHNTHSFDENFINQFINNLDISY